ncbi:MAG TPA: succinate dehydrogenase, partial [Rhabdochlamydiaceae bacterium]
MTSQVIPRAFIWRRIHSLMGLWLVLFLFEHLLVNSQAALLLGNNARGFVDGVNAIHNLPYLPIIEIFLLGFPIAIHGVLGVKYLFTAKFNSGGSDG